MDQSVKLPFGNVILEGDLGLPDGAKGVVLFAHGSGSGRHSPRNQFVAQHLRSAGLATLLIDLLTEKEEAEERYTAHLRFDVPFLADRLVAATDWLRTNRQTMDLPIGYFGASTGAAAALVAATERSEVVSAVVSRGGRPDLAGAALPQVQAPTLMLVGGNDGPVIPLNEQALKKLGAPQKQLLIVPGASHLFEEPGTLEQVAQHAADWFLQHLSK